LADLVELQTRFARNKDFAMVGICLDPKAKGAEIDRTLGRHGIKWSQIHDGLGWETGPAKVWGIEGLPATFLIGRTGRFIAIDPVAPDLVALVSKALATPLRSR